MRCEEREGREFAEKWVDLSRRPCHTSDCGLRRPTVVGYETKERIREVEIFAVAAKGAKGLLVTPPTQRKAHHSNPGLRGVEKRSS